MTDGPSTPPPPPGGGGWGFPEHPGGDDAYRDAGAPPHVDEVLGNTGHLPPPPPGTKELRWRFDFQTGKGPGSDAGDESPDHANRGRLDRAFPPHSKARLVLFVVAIPIIAAFISLIRGGEGGLLQWAFVTLAALALTIGAWFEARSQAAAPTWSEPTSSEPTPVVLADAGSRSTLGHVLTPFLVAFLLMAGFMLAIDPVDPLLSLGMSAGASLYLGLLWHLRGTIPGLILLSLGLGAIAAIALGIITFIATFGGGADYNFWAYWLGSSAVAVPFVWPAWRKLRGFELSRPIAIVFGVMAVLTVLLAAVTSRTYEPADGTSPSADGVVERDWAVPATDEVVGAPTEGEAAARFFAAWRFGNRAGAHRVASTAAVDALFAVTPTNRDRLLGCGVFEGRLAECRIDSVNGGLLTLRWQAGGESTFWIYSVAPTY